MPSAPTTALSQTPSSRFSREIAQALNAGVTTDQMTLYVTLLDASKLKLDRSLPLEHISFSAEGMRFLDVAVVQGGVSTSVLRLNEELPETSPDEVITTKPLKKRAVKKTS